MANSQIFIVNNVVLVDHHVKFVIHSKIALNVKLAIFYSSLSHLLLMLLLHTAYHNAHLEHSYQHIQQSQNAKPASSPVVHALVPININA